MVISSGGGSSSKGQQITASVTLPAQLPLGQSVTAQTASGQPLPSWLTFNAATGKFSGTAPAGSAALTVNVTIPQANGTSQVVQMTLGAQ